MAFDVFRYFVVTASFDCCISTSELLAALMTKKTKTVQNCQNLQKLQ